MTLAGEGHFVIADSVPPPPSPWNGGQLYCKAVAGNAEAAARKGSETETWPATTIMFLRTRAVSLCPNPASAKSGDVERVKSIP